MIEIGRVGGKRSAERRRQKGSQPGRGAAEMPNEPGYSPAENALPGVAEHEGLTQSAAEQTEVQPPPEQSGENPQHSTGASG
jgi:hypothetical protein